MSIGRPYHVGDADRERPDPLAEPEGYGARPGQQDDAPLDVCAHMTGPERHCDVPAGEVVWIGCQRGEHAGPLGFCPPHAREVISYRGLATCAQCGGRAVILKRTDTAGNELPLTDGSRMSEAHDLLKRIWEANVR